MKLCFHCTNFTQPCSTKRIQDSIPWKRHLCCFPPRTSSSLIHVPSFPGYHAYSIKQGITEFQSWRGFFPRSHSMYLLNPRFSLHSKTGSMRSPSKEQGNSSLPLKVAHNGMAPITERFYVEIKPISLQFFQFVWDQHVPRKE